MYLSRIHLINWRSYADAIFEFKKPTERKPVVLVGAMNGHGKTSLLISLYLGLFGRFGLRYCEGFRTSSNEDTESYRKAISRYRRNTASPEEPTVLDVTFTPTLNDADEDEIRVVRRWYFTSSNQPKPGDAFEEAQIYVGERPVKSSDLDAVHDRIEKYLFPAHVAPAFFFDGEQAQALIEGTGESGIKKAVEVMFGTKIISELADQIRHYLARAHGNAGGKRRGSEKQEELNEKLHDRDQLNERIGKLQGEHQRLEKEKEGLERERTHLTEQLARLGGATARDAAQLQAEYLKAEKEKNETERTVAESVRGLGIALALARLAIPIRNRLRSESLLESWEGLKRGTLEKKEQVLSVAMPEPPEADPLLGHLAGGIRAQVKERFIKALEKIYEPPEPGTAREYLLGHVKGEMRSKVLNNLHQVQVTDCIRVRAEAKRLKDAREAFEEATARRERQRNLPQETKELSNKIGRVNLQVDEAIRRLGAIENEIKKLKADLHILNKEIGEIQEELSRLEPEQRRIAVAERVYSVLGELEEKLKPATSKRIEEFVTKYFLKIADRRFKGGLIHLQDGSEPMIQLPQGDPIRLMKQLSGFEKRSFGIAFSLALADITKRRIPLVVDTPLGNADSEYRPRTLDALTDFDLDQIIILTHDEEVTPKLVDRINGHICQTFLVEFHEREKISTVHPDKFF